MINKQADTVVQAIGKIDDGATIMVGGFGTVYSGRVDRRLAKGVGGQPNASPHFGE